MSTAAFAGAVVGAAATAAFAVMAVDKAIAWFIDIPDTPENEIRGWEIEKEGTDQPIPVIYGKRRVSAINVFKEVEAGNTKIFWKVGVFCEGPVEEVGESVVDIFIDDVPLSDARFFGKYSIYHDDVPDTVVTGGNDVFRLYFFTGQKTGRYQQQLAAASSNWDSTKSFEKLCYVVYRFKYDPDLFSGEPRIKVVIKGKRTADLTVPRYTENTWSDNPVNHIYDYLTNTIYGKGLDQADMDLVAFRAAALKAKTLESQFTGGSNDLIFRSNYTLDTNKTLFDNTKQLLANFRGLFTFVNGTYSVKIEDDEQPVINLTRNEIVDGQLRYQGENKSSRFNRVIVKYVNPVQNWQIDEVAWPSFGSNEEAQLLTEDNNEVLENTLTIASITNKYQAREWARIICLTSRKNMLVSGKFTAEALEAAAGDLVTLDVSEEAAVFSAYPAEFLAGDFATDIYYEESPSDFSNTYKVPYRVMKSRINPDGTIELTLREHQPSIFPWLSDAEIPDSGSLQLPDPYDQTTITVPDFAISEGSELADNGDINNFMGATWTESPNGFVGLYELRWRKSGSTNAYKYVQSRTTSAELMGVRVGTTYEVSIRAIIETLSIKGGWSDSETLLITNRDSSQIETFAQESEPTAIGIGDLWIKTSTRQLYRWNGSSWVAQTAADVADSADVTGDNTANDTVNVGDSTAEDVGDAFSGYRTLTEGIRVLDGAVFRTVAKGLLYSSARDGDSVTFPESWTEMPIIAPLAGGLSFASSGLTGDQSIDFTPLDTSTSGFTMRARIKETAGTITAITDTVVSTGSNPSGLDHSINKTESGEAWDDKYTFDIDVTVQNDSGASGYITGDMRVGFYTNSGSGWVLRATETFVGDSAGTITTYAARTKTVTVDGLGVNDDFGINIESQRFSGGALTFNSVKYGLTTAPTSVSATPTGSSDIPFFVLGGN